MLVVGGEEAWSAVALVVQRTWSGRGLGRPRTGTSQRHPAEFPGAGGSWVANASGRNTDRMPLAHHFSGNRAATCCIQDGSWVNTKKTRR